MCEWPDNPERCPVRCINKYLEKRNPNCPALWQMPRTYNTGKFNESDAVWYCNVPLGKNTSDNLLGRMSNKAGLSTHFTSHCIRATSVTILKAAGLENSRVRSVTGLNRVMQRNTDNSATGVVFGNSQQFCGSSEGCIAQSHHSVKKSS